MAAEIILDEIDNSDVNMIGPTQAQIIRSGFISEVPASVTSDPEEFLVKCIQILKDQEGIKYGDPHPAWPNSLLNQVRASGERDTGTTGARIRLVHSPFEGVTPSARVVSVARLRKIVVTDRIPGTGLMFALSYNQPGDTTFAVPEDICRISVRRTVPVITVVAIVQGTLDEAELIDACDAFDLVNNADWMGRPKGAWITDGATVGAGVRG